MPPMLTPVAIVPLGTGSVVVGGGSAAGSAEASADDRLRVCDRVVMRLGLGLRAPK